MGDNAQEEAISWRRISILYLCLFVLGFLTLVLASILNIDNLGENTLALLGIVYLVILFVLLLKVAGEFGKLGFCKRLSNLPIFRAKLVFPLKEHEIPRLFGFIASLVPTAITLALALVAAMATSGIIELAGA